MHVCTPSPLLTWRDVARLASGAFPLFEAVEHLHDEKDGWHEDASQDKSDDEPHDPAFLSFECATLFAGEHATRSIVCLFRDGSVRIENPAPNATENPGPPGMSLVQANSPLGSRLETS